MNIRTNWGTWSYEGATLIYILVTLGDLPSLDDEVVEPTFVYALETFLYSVYPEGHPYQEWLEVLFSEPSDKPGGNLSLLHVRN